MPLASAAALAACASQPPPRPAPPPPPPAASSEAPRPAQYVVVRGTASALARFPRGTIVPPTSRVCLRGGETLTLVHPSTGARITYGEGCEQRVPEPSGDQTPAVNTGAP